MNDKYKKEINSFKINLLWQICFKNLLIWSAVYAFFIGVIIIVQKTMGYAVNESEILIFLGLFILGVIVSFIMAKKRSVISNSAVYALFDKVNNCGGLLMASENVSTSEWNNELPVPESIKIKWNKDKIGAVFAVSLLFLISAFLCPESVLTIKNNQLNIKPDLEKISEDVELLKEEDIISEKKAEELAKNIEEIGVNAEAEDPVKTWEAMDHLKNSLSMSAKEAAENAIADMSQLSLNEQIANALSSEISLNTEELKMAMQELSKLTNKTMKNIPQLGLFLTPELAKALQNANFSKEQLNELQKLMAKYKDGMGKQIDKLSMAKLINKEMLKKCKNASECSMGDLKNYAMANSLSQIFYDELAKNLVNAQCEKGKWNGKIGRGFSPAKMTYGEEAKEEGTEFVEQQLPLSMMPSLKNSNTIGVSFTAPEAKENKEIISGSLNKVKNAGGSSNKHIILPKHKATIKRYFDN